MATRIVTAEDEPTLREALAELLKDVGYEVLQAANGKEVQQFILKEPVDLVLTNVRMMRFLGTEAAAGEMIKRLSATGSAGENSGQLVFGLYRLAAPRHDRQGDGCGV